MLNRLFQDVDHIYLALGATDFRRQIKGLCNMVLFDLDLDPYKESCVFVFCNKRRNAIKVLRYDKNGFVLAHKKLLEKMKFDWPRDIGQAKEITKKQIEWLLEGLEIEPKKAHHRIHLKQKDICY